VGERSFYNFSNPAFEVFSLDESARLGSNERDGHFNVLINREQRLSKQSLAFEQTLGFFPNPKYFELGSFSFIGSSLSGFNWLLFIGFQNLFFNEFYPEFEFFEFKPQIYRLVTFMWDWFERRIGADDLELLEVDVTLRAWRFEMRPKLKTLYKINAQNLFFTSIVRLISFSFTKVLEIDQEINSVFFKFQCARYFSSMFMNSSISNRYGASFGFLVQLIRFGFVGEDLRPYY